MTLVGVGHALADAFAFVDEDVPKTMGLHPGSFNRVPDYRMRAILATLRQKTLMAGGSAANTVKLVSRLGVDAHFVGQCGHDEAGQIFEAEMLNAGVKVNLTKSDTPTGLCVTFLSPQQARTIATFRSASGDLPVGLLGNTLFQAADLIVIEGYLLDEPEFLDDLMHRCRVAKKPVTLDTGDGALVTGHRETLLRHLISGNIRHFFLRESDAATLTGMDATGSLAQLSKLVETVVLEREDGSHLVSSGGPVIEIPSAGSLSVDASGAGDAFQAGFLWALDQGWSLARAGRAGTLVAACVAQQPGTRIDDVRWAALTADLHGLKPSA